MNASAIPQAVIYGIFDREKAKNLLWKYEYGTPLPAPDAVTVQEREEKDVRFCAGKAVLEKLTVNVTVGSKTEGFPVTAFYPADGKKHPTVVFLNFRPDVPDRYLPAEELIDKGFAVVSVPYLDVSSDDNDFSSGIASLFDIDRSNPHAPGKIMLWAYSASRVADILEGSCFADTSDLSVAGHSRLGKTALVAGALDSRFRYIYSNDSGCSGAALFRGKKGEKISDITKNFPFWFCPGFREFADNENALPFDQHFLLALCADRFLYIASAEQDSWADPEAELKACIEASSAAKAQGMSGLCESEIKPTPFATHSGSIGYHIRQGCHYIGREDWNLFTDFIQEQKNA